MKYLSGIFALNLMCDLDTFGDWHTSAIDWKMENSKNWPEIDKFMGKEYMMQWVRYKKEVGL